VTVGILDSLYDPEAILENAEAFEWGTAEDYVDSDSPDTAGHGLGVWLLAAAFASRASFNMYRAADSNGWLTTSNYLRALGQAHREDGVDVLNVSAGIPRSDCRPGDRCTVCRRTGEAVEDGMVVVAAVGNRPDVQRVCCPGSAADVVTVGGMDCRCELHGADATVVGVDGPLPDGPYCGPYWVEGDLDDPRKATGIYCGQDGCNGDSECSHRQDRPWDGNVPAADGKPDVLAPAQFPNVTSAGAINLIAGTSYATPIVTGFVASVLSAFRAAGSDPSPDDIQTALRESGRPVPDSSIPRLSGQAALEAVAEALDVRLSYR
jgi:hypothetical protein